MQVGFKTQMKYQQWGILTEIISTELINKSEMPALRKKLCTKKNNKKREDIEIVRMVNQQINVGPIIFTLKLTPNSGKDGILLWNFIVFIQAMILSL